MVGTVHLNNRNEEFLTQTEELDHRKLLQVDLIFIGNVVEFQARI